ADADALTAERRETLAIGTLRHREVACRVRELVSRFVCERREEGEVVHCHDSLAAGEGVVALLEEGVAQAGWRAAVVQFAVDLKRLDSVLGIDPALGVVG